MTSIEADLAEAVSLQKAGRTDAARLLYERMLKRVPDHSVANHNLGIISMQRGRYSEGASYFKRALDAEPGRELFQRSYARSLAMTGRDMPHALPSSVTLTNGAPAAASGKQRAQSCLLEGNRLTEQGDCARAIGAFKMAITLDPSLAAAYHHLGSLLSENGQIAAGFDYLMQHAQLVRGEGVSPCEGEPLHKIQHDQEQRAYLIAAGFLPQGSERLPFHIGDGARVVGEAINRRAAAAARLPMWTSVDPQVLVIDDFLMPSALERLRTYCAESTVWHRVYDAGYIGATPADGFACPLLAQIAEEVVEVYREIIKGHAFQYLGAFKYDSALSTGTNIHADFSAVNLNLYIAPDSANLDANSGGMAIWDVAARDEREMRHFNRNDAAIRAHLARARVTRIPHRANRAVLFKSSLFHRTDVCRFKDGYLNKRINVSLLFGKFGDTTA